MSQYRSITHCTLNEYGDEEIELVYNNGFIRDLFKLDEKKETWICSEGIWYNKDTKQGASADKFYELQNAKNWVRVRNLYDDLMSK